MITKAIHAQKIHEFLYFNYSHVKLTVTTASMKEDNRYTCNTNFAAYIKTMHWQKCLQYCVCTILCVYKLILHTYIVSQSLYSGKELIVEQSLIKTAIQAMSVQHCTSLVSCLLHFLSLNEYYKCKRLETSSLYTYFVLSFKCIHSINVNISCNFIVFGLNL